MIKDFILKWFPPAVCKAELNQELEDFYAQSKDYHTMISSGDKSLHPQVNLLLCILKKGGKYAEIGCGSGLVASLVAKQAYVDGYDVSSIAIKRAEEMCCTNAEFHEASAEHIPSEDAVYDGVYSFEVLEHVWNPLDAVKEMLRITKPGGFIMISVPLYFSLDMNLSKRSLARLSDTFMAVLRYAHDTIRNVAYINVMPDLDGEVYPDCDLITALMPSNFVRKITKFGCDIVFWDTTYMCAHKEGSQTDLGFQKLTSKKFFRNYGDHLLLLARKR